MASKLCCTAEQESNPGSPELPNARIAELPTPARLPLLQKPVDSISSHFTSARPEDLHELRQIFDNAKDAEPLRVPPPRAPGHARLNKPSVYSLHSLHKMKSMRSLIRRKFSRDLSKKPSKVSIYSKKSATSAADTVVKQRNDGPNVQVKITKDDLKKDLLSDKHPDEGGYDSDAKVLDELARNIGKKTPNKRPSIHSIDWTASTASKPTPESWSKSHQRSDSTQHLQPYHIKSAQSAPAFNNRISQAFSTPNLEVNTSKDRDPRLRRSHSATSISLAEYSPLSPLRLPSLKSHDPDGIPWSVALNESLRLSQFPPCSHRITPEQSQASLKQHQGDKRAASKFQNTENAVHKEPPSGEEEEPTTPSTVVQIRAREPTVPTTPRQRGSIGGMIHDDPARITKEVLEGKEDAIKEDDGADEDRSHRSVHLHSMRISHHLRSGSLLSWDSLADAADLPNPSSSSNPYNTFRDRSCSNFSRTSNTQQQPNRHERQTSSSGFASSRVPSKWGRVVSNGIREDKSSIYSSRPQSLIDSFGRSMINLPRTPTKRETSTARSSVEQPKLRRSNSYPTDNDDTPKPARRYGLTNLRNVASHTISRQRWDDAPQLARNNSVATTKKSKFREEFSPSPPKKKLTPSISLMRFFNSKRHNTCSQSETNVKSPDLVHGTDALLEIPGSSQPEHSQTRSIVSLETEKKALGSDKQASPVWERALQNYQDERAAMFLPENKELATRVSPFRERSPSTTTRLGKSQEPERKESCTLRRSSAFLEPPSPSNIELEEQPPLPTRRTALAGDDSKVPDPIQATRKRFEQQTDTAETVGAWGRYPSHTRAERTSSAGHLDKVETRDFALEAAIKFAMGETKDHNDEKVDPRTRPTTPPFLLGQKKRKKKVGSTRMAKSQSMTFGRSFLKNYTRIFRSQSIEFYKHGQGHRSSIATGGTLEYPELEMIPDVWGRGAIGETSGESGHGNEATDAILEEYGPGDKKGKGRMKEEEASTEFRALGASSRPTTGNLLQAGLDGTRDTARVWSAYYENCLPSFPRTSIELDFGFEAFGAPARRSLESRRTSLHSRTMPVRYTKHSRNASRLSHLSIGSHGSARPSLVSLGDNELGKASPDTEMLKANADVVGADGRSIVSVRRSTMDLINQYQEQENTERERVLRIMRTESMRDNAKVKVL